MRWISGEISRVKAEIPRHDARATISLASFVAKSGRVERARADPGAPKGRAMDVEFPENRGTPERRAGGAWGALTRRLGEARGGEGRGVIGGAPRRHGEDFVCVATRRASAGKSDIDRGSSLLFDLRFGRKGANLIWNLTFRSNYLILSQMFGRVTKFNRSASC